MIIMVGFGRHSELKWRCPFCKKGIIRIYFKEGYIQSTASSISAGKKYTKHKVDGQIESVGNGCPVCGKSAKEIKKAFETGTIKEISHEERLKRLQTAGLPTKIMRKR